jgi:hypothetical protein
MTAPASVPFVERPSAFSTPERQLQRVAGFLDRAREWDANVRVGGEPHNRPGWFYAPTVVTDVNPASEIIQREVFGPVVTIQRAESDDEILSMANGVDYGLSASIWIANLAPTMRFTTELDFGMDTPEPLAPLRSWRLSRFVPPTTPDAHGLRALGNRPEPARRDVRERRRTCQRDCA